jgi:type II secretory pathway pseudopilin PulG
MSTEREMIGGHEIRKPGDQVRRRRAFTLIEMITVLTIIILVLAIAIPVWNALMGGTNTAAAQNEISAFISNARADAIYNRQIIGVCFFVDPNTQQTAMAEVQVQPLNQGGTITPLFTPNGLPPYALPANGLVNSLELVNNPDPNTPGNTIFYRDVTLLPKGVGVGLNNNTYTYNQYNQWGGPNSGNYPELDRYRRLGAIMFAPDGTLITIPFGIPLKEQFTLTGATTENLLCQRVGMYYPAGGGSDMGSNVTPNAGNALLPLTSSVGLVVFDEDAYRAQHAYLTVNASGTATTIGDGAQFNDWDMNYYFFTAASPTNPIYETSYADKFIEENWIDQNGIALLVNPFNGSLIKAK